MTDPKNAVATQRGRYYRDPAGGPDLISVTNVTGTSVAKFGLVPWGAGLVADHVIADPVAVAHRAHTEPGVLRKELVGLPNDYRERATDLGSRVHHRAHAIVIGKPAPADPEVEPYAVQLARWFRLWRVDFDRDVEAVETTVLHRRHGYAGTGDLWIWLPTGPGGRRELWLIDYKTSAKKPATTVYEDQPYQLAAYRYAEVALLPDDSEMPAPRPRRTAVLNLRPRSHRLIELPTGRDVYRGFLGALANARQLHATRTADFPTILPPWAPGSETRKAA
ncbi:hypothetical protein RM572_21715 [Streptomyces sp. DSM 42041]|uniref:PD-(D/E)XK endonuclease-like domain-containing protein n=1 Tax=Streptomyces hazeniae TaxID=3075538 RepID=A0ABU2NXC2_9ACTN|nr:hypothetical protein [Streptomyces sp. DSM 42041]MDT0381379.1 hypothetical protein [Streptomyces sp. DSM 42041]